MQHLEVVSGSDVSILALAKITKQNKIFWIAISRVKSRVCSWIFFFKVSLRIGGRHQEDIKIFSFQTKNLSQQQKLWKGNNAVVPGVNYGQSCLPTSSLQYI